jgi:hypothetical protein
LSSEGLASGDGPAYGAYVRSADLGRSAHHSLRRHQFVSLVLL